LNHNLVSATESAAAILIWIQESSSSVPSLQLRYLCTVKLLLEAPGLY